MDGTTATRLLADLPSATGTGLLLPLLLLPLLGAAICGLLGRWLTTKLGERAVAAVAIGALAAAAVVACIAFFRLTGLPAGQRLLQQHVFALLQMRDLNIDFALAFDPLSATFVLVITLVGTLIHIYAAGYMHGDAGYARFFAYLNLFVFSMLLLVLGDSLFLAFFGWEGVGLCSYLLIGFWYRDEVNGAAGKKAFLANRVGDWGYLAGVVLLLAALAGTFASPSESPRAKFEVATRAEPAEITAVGPSLRFRDLNAFVTAVDAQGERIVADALVDARLWGIPVVLLIGLAFFLAMAGKSAQIPLYVWLPDAMAGPTPVSALIHAATMVTAGVYLSARLAPLYALSPGALDVIASVGLATALLAALLAAVQHDIKKVLAYSTISQLGYMFVAIGVGAPGAAVFHVVTHAAFKACLFLAAGSVIHGMAHVVDEGPVTLSDRRRRLEPDPHDPQDLRNMGGLASALPRTHLAYLLGSIALAGLPIAAGFYSKDEILWRALVAPAHPAPTVLFLAGVFTAGLTAFYIARSYYLAFVAPAAVRSQAAHEAPAVMTIPVLLLAGAAVTIGAALGWPEAWGGHPLIESWLEPVLPPAPGSLASGAARFGGHEVAAAIVAQTFGVATAVAGWLLARWLYRNPRRTGAALRLLRDRFERTHKVLWNRFHVDDLYRELVVHPVEDFARAADFIDRRLIEGIVANLARIARGAAALGGAIDRFVIDGLIDGLTAGLVAVGRRFQKLQSGRLNQYSLGIALGAALLVVIAWVIR